MEENTDTFGELVMLCEDFMQTAIGVNSNFQVKDLPLSSFTKFCKFFSFSGFS